MEQLCIVAYVFGGYTPFIPFYVYSVLKSYPDYFVKIYVHEQLPEKEKICLELVRQRGYDRFQIVENYRDVILAKQPNGINDNKVLKVLRWLLPYEEFKDFDYVYIGDIDYIIIREEPPLLQGHLQHCAQTGLPYSNMIRKNNSRRLSGLHFFKIKEYYKKMNDIINYYANNLEALLQLLSQYQKSPNESFLYHIVSQGIGVTEKIEDGREYHYRPDHGFHLGNIRDGVVRRDGCLLHYQSNKELLAYCHDETMCAMLHILPVKEIIYLFYHLVEKPRLTLKVKAYKLLWDLCNMTKKL